jgi:ASC-1-like (ASCH) protein
MAIIKKKITPDYFDLVNFGKKNFDLRVAEFEVKEGDTIILEEWNPKTKQYTGRTIEREAGYVLKFNLNTFGQEDLIKEKGLVVFSLKEKRRDYSK